MPQSAAERRRQKSAELKAERIRAAKRRKAAKVAATVVAGAAVVGFLGFAGYMVYEDRYRPIDGLVELGEMPGGDHVPEPPDYEQSPPAGGPHFETWQNCGVYDEPIADFLAVHSQEHGAVWIAYDPDLPEDEVATLEELATPGSYVLVSPYYGDMDGPIVASSWGRQLAVDAADDRDLTRFLRRYEQANDVPEPGAVCSGGVAETAEELEALGFATGTPGVEAPDDADDADEAEDTADDEAEEEDEDSEDEEEE